MIVGELELDPISKSVTLRGKAIRLANKEYELLKLLLENKNIAVSRETMLKNVWGYDYEGNERAVDDHIRKLRKALDEYGGKIETINNYGYKIVSE